MRTSVASSKPTRGSLPSPTLLSAGFMAKQHLRNSNRKILDIALACGFNDIGHFNRKFRELTGGLPATTARSGLGHDCFQLALAVCPVGEGLFKTLPEGGAMVGVDEVAEFVGDHVVDALTRRLDETGVER